MRRWSLRLAICGPSMLCKGLEAPVIARVFMDQTLVDVAGISNVESGDTAVVIEVSGQREISTYDLSEASGIITSKVLSHLNTRFHRITI